MPDSAVSRWLRWIVLGGSVLVAILLVVEILPPSSLSETDSEVYQPARITLVIDYGDGMIATYQGVAIEPRETLFSVTERMAKDNRFDFKFEEYAGVGPLVVQIGSRKPDTGEYWQYWINGVYGTVGAGSYQLASGDVATWKLTGERPQ